MTEAITLKNKAEWIKLPDGSWGIALARSLGTASEAARAAGLLTAIVVRKNGETSYEKVGEPADATTNAYRCA